MRLALLGAIVCALLLAGCNGGGSTTTYTYVKSNLSLPGGGEMLAEAPGDGTVQVAVCRDGEVYGPEVVDDDMREKVLRPMGQPVDHPKLAEWRRQLAAVDEMIEDPHTGAEAVVKALADFPFEGALGHRLVAWSLDDPARATEALDAVGSVRIEEESATILICCALAGRHLDDDRLAGWVARPGIGGQPEASQLLVDAKPAGPVTWRAAVGAIGHALGSDRTKIYDHVAPRLAASPDDANRLVDALERLYGNDRRKAAERMLACEDISAAFARGCLRRIELFYGSDRGTVYVTAARLVLEDPEAVPLLADRVDELYGGARAKAALTVISWPETPASVSAAYIGTIESFYGSDRSEVLRAIIASPGFTGETQLACVKATKLVFSPRDRRKILGEIARSERATEAAKDEAVRRLAED